MRFQVPQFIETEEKIVGPFSIKQFVIVAMGGSILFILYFAVPPGIFVILGIIIAAIFLSLALLKINDIPLYIYLLYVMSYLANPKKYIYQLRDKDDYNAK